VGHLSTTKLTAKNQRFASYTEKSHMVENCPIRSQGHKCASYLDSVASGLGFYHVETPKVEEKSTMDFTNCGLVYIESRDITKEEFQLELATCFNPNWPR
jgi:hypothetical protein